jgi:hypothetical protein
MEAIFRQILVTATEPRQYKRQGWWVLLAQRA